MYRFSRCSQTSINNTPSKNTKYDNYTPRKRYVKDQEQFSAYHKDYSRQKPSFSPLKQPLREQQSHYPISNYRSLSASRKQPQPRITLQQPDQNMTFGIAQYQKSYDYELPEELQDCTNLVTNRPSLRKQQLKKNCQERQSYTRVIRDNQNDDCSNRTREMYSRGMIQPEKINITPIRLHRNKENQISLTQKMTALQNKIARLERMTPQRHGTTRSNRLTESYGYESSVVLFEKQEPRTQSTSQVSCSERQNELLSRVSLGRLVEQQEGQNEIEMIQDLSYKISSKLKSIIRNFS